MGGAVAFAARLALAAVFACSAATKLAHPAAFAIGLADFGVPAAATMARLLPPVEGAVAVVLVAVPDEAWPAVVALALLGLFTAAVVANLLRGEAAPCPCFGVSSSRPTSAATVARNGCLLALAVIATGSTDGADPAPAVLLAAVAVLGTVLALRRFG